MRSEKPDSHHSWDLWEHTSGSGHWNSAGGFKIVVKGEIKCVYEI